MSLFDYLPITSGSWGFNGEMTINFWFNFHDRQRHVKVVDCNELFLQTEEDVRSEMLDTFIKFTPLYAYFTKMRVGLLSKS